MLDGNLGSQLFCLCASVCGTAKKTGWMHAHNSLRWELVNLIEAVDAVKSRGTIKAWEANCLKTAWNSHYIHIHAHHDNEDELFVPFAKTRFHYPEKVSSTFRAFEKSSIDI